MMKFRDAIRSVGVLLALWYALVLLVTLVAFGAVTYLYLSDELLATLDDSIDTELEWTSNLLALEGRRTPDVFHVDSAAQRIRDLLDVHFALNPRNYIVLVTSADGRILYESYNRQRDLLAAEAIRDTIPFFVSLPDRQYGQIRVAALRAAEHMVQIAYPYRWITITLDHTARIFYLLIPVAVLLSFTGGVFMASIALRPVGHIARTARRITVERLSDRIPERTVDDELGILIKTINMMIGRLEVSFNEMKNFSMEVAHELKTPLTILKGETELALARPPAGEDLQTLLTSFLEETVRLSRIVDDLLTVSKADAGQLNLRHDPVDLKSLLSEIAEDASLLADTRDLSVRMDQNDPAWISGDEVRLRQVFRNIVSNAVSYSDPGGLITIRSAAGGGHVRISFADSGMGIAREDLEHIFERMYRAGSARERNISGSGLGLSIAHRIVRLHGGEISVSSTPGGGSTFTIKLPLLTP